MSSDSYFKNWAKPGPKVPGGRSPEEGETLDAISGHYKLFQLKNGHRFSTDDLLVAWYGTTWCPSARTALDLGSGIGTVGMISAWRLQGARFTTVEAQEISIQLVNKSLAYNGLSDRYEIRGGDFRDPSIIGNNEQFDLITGSPPYFPLGSGIQGDHPQKVACRFEVRGDIKDYCDTASAHLALGGVFACVFPIHPIEQKQRVLNAAREASLVIVRERAIVFREGEPPLLGLFLMMKAEHLPEGMRARTWVEPALIIRTQDGLVHPEYQAIKLSIGFPP